jgi:IS605 OrfB family transposase
MSDVNHQISKTLVNRYGSNALFVIEDLTGVSFDEQNLSHHKAKGRNELRSWTFYQLEQFLTYKAVEAGSYVIKVPADYTSQRCPKCGRIHKENRNHDTHEYICDACGYRSNDDRVGAMNLYTLGTLYVSGDSNPRFGPRKIN